MAKELTVNKFQAGMGFILKKAINTHSLNDTNYGIYNENQTIASIRNLIKTKSEKSTKVSKNPLVSLARLSAAKSTISENENKSQVQIICEVMH